MALSSLTYTARGVGPYPVHALPYLDSADLTFTVDDVLVAGTVDDAAKLVTLTAPPAAGAVVRIIRTTPRGVDERLTQFLDLATGSAGLTGDLLDQDYRQTLYILGEAHDLAEGVDASTGIALGDDGQWAGESERVTNLVDGCSPNDLVTKAQLDAIAAATPLPTVGGGDNDDGLFVSAGAWAARTPVQGRTHLGLGTVSTLASGTAANEVVALDGSGFAPANSGQNIDLTSHPTVLLRTRSTVVLVSIVQGGNGLAATSSTWSQNSTSRFATATAWVSRVELDNSSELDGNFTPGRFDLSAGTWRVTWTLKARQTSASGNMGFRITNNDDTSGQTIFYDLGIHRIVRQYNSGQRYTCMFQDQLIMANASPFSIVFRWALGTTGANNDADIDILFNKISTSVAS